MIRLGRVETKAYQLLKEFGNKGIPVPVGKIAEFLNLAVQYAPFDGNLSGVLYRDESSNVIGVNKQEPPRRQRFTIAHEIGHFLLHEGFTVHIDSKTSLKLSFRNESSSIGNSIQEIEANAFAGALLMPEDYVRQEFYALFSSGIDPSPEEEHISTLADKFDVSQQSMIIRLSRLGLLEQFY